MNQDQPHRIATRSLRHTLASATLVVSIAGGFVFGLSHPGAAQDDGTGAATPTPPTECLTVPATQNPVVPATGLVGTPVAEQAATPIASPVTGDAATPIASPVIDQPSFAVDDAANAELLSELESTAEAIFGCLNERNFDGYARMTSDLYRGHLFGSDQEIPATQFVELAATLPDADNRLIEMSSLRVTDSTTVSVEVTYLSAHQQRTGIWTFSKEGVDGASTWVLQNEELIPVETPLGAYVIDVTFQDNGYTLDPSSADGSDVVLNLSNPTQNDHEALVLRFDDDVTTETLLQSTSASLPQGVTLIGQSTVLAGGQGTMFLTGLQPGTYTIVDLLPGEDGLPNLSNGMTATFTVSN